MTKPFINDSDIQEIVNDIKPIITQFEGKTILITGACGFLGHYFTAVFAYLNTHHLKQKASIICIDNLIVHPHYQMDDSSEYIQYIKHDVTTPIELDKKVDYILHLAGIASPIYYRKYPLETLEVSISGTRNMLEIAKKDQAKLLFFSSSEIYGDPDPKHIPTKESYRGNVTCQGPRACYDESKRVGETLCWIYHDYFSVHTNVVRPFNVYGPGMFENDYRVLPNFAEQIKHNQPLKIYGNGKQTRTFCYVTDAIQGFLKVLCSGVPGGVYNVGNPEPEISMLELVSLSEKILQKDIPHELIDYPDSYPADEPNRRCPDIQKATTQAGYSPTIAIEEGLLRFYNWALT